MRHAIGASNRKRTDSWHFAYLHQYFLLVSCMFFINDISRNISIKIKENKFNFSKNQFFYRFLFKLLKKPSEIYSNSCYNLIILLIINDHNLFSFFFSLLSIISVCFTALAMLESIFFS